VFVPDDFELDESIKRKISVRGKMGYLGPRTKCSRFITAQRSLMGDLGEPIQKTGFSAVLGSFSMKSDSVFIIFLERIATAKNFFIFGIHFHC
jgi:hypothetical protein